MKPIPLRTCPVCKQPSICNMCAQCHTKGCNFRIDNPNYEQLRDLMMIRGLSGLISKDGLEKILAS